MLIGYHPDDFRSESNAISHDFEMNFSVWLENANGNDIAMIWPWNAFAFIYIPMCGAIFGNEFYYSGPLIKIYLLKRNAHQVTIID